MPLPELVEDESVAPSIDDRHKAVPALYQHCVTIYEAMKKDAKMVEVVGYDGDVLVWEGFTTKLFHTHTLPVPYYTKILQHLQSMDCIRQVRRGGSTTPSMWAVLQAPSVSLFRTKGQTNLSPSAKTKASDTEQMRQSLRDLSARVNSLEGKVTNLEDIIIAQDQRIKDLENA